MPAPPGSSPGRHGQATTLRSNGRISRRPSQAGGETRPWSVQAGSPPSQQPSSHGHEEGEPVRQGPGRRDPGVDLTSWPGGQGSLRGVRRTEPRDGIRRAAGRSTGQRPQWGPDGARHPHGPPFPWRPQQGRGQRAPGPAVRHSLPRGTSPVCHRDLGLRRPHSRLHAPWGAVGHPAAQRRARALPPRAT